MIELFMRGGIFMWILLLIALINIVLTVIKARQLFYVNPGNLRQMDHGVNAILFWGGIAVVTGYISHYLGVYLAMMEIFKASDISPAIVAGGYAVSLLTVLFGLLIFLISAIIWFVFRCRLKQIQRRLS